MNKKISDRSSLKKSKLIKRTLEILGLKIANPRSVLVMKLLLGKTSKEEIKKMLVSIAERL